MSDVWSKALGCALIAATWFAVSSGSAGCYVQRESGESSPYDGCSSCHGSKKNAGSPLARGAPPYDVSGNTSSAFIGVGAHSSHALASSTHAEIPCGECHIQPGATDDVGHADSPLPAEVVFGAVATQKGNVPMWSRETLRCSSTYCHGGEQNAIWTAPRTSDQACGTCHGIPPLAPHPQLGADARMRCGSCHSAVMDGKGNFSHPERHVNGVVELTDNLTCTGGCHGDQSSPAPPRDTLGNIDATANGVGAHQAHLHGGTSSRSLACQECHIVPKAVFEGAHLDGTTELVFGAVASARSYVPTWDPATRTCSDAYCHSPSPAKKNPSPAFTATIADCNGCHTVPPAPPHPQPTVNATFSNCNGCHGEVIAVDNQTITARDKHVDGIVQVSVPACSGGCHGGSGGPAPPRDVAGNTVTTSPGVGAHQSHLGAIAWARTVACSDCHVVPSSVASPGHTDGTQPKVTFGGVATAFAAKPTYASGTCAQTFCHGDSFVAGHASGGTLTQPTWTKVDGTQATCGNCHSLPPPGPHTTATDCWSCHHNMQSDGTFSRPDTHVDGVVTFNP